MGFFTILTQGIKNGAVLPCLIGIDMRQDTQHVVTQKPTMYESDCVHHCSNTSYIENLFILTAQKNLLMNTELLPSLTMLTYNKEHTGENEAYSHCQKYAHCAICVCVYQHYAYISHLH